MTLNELLRTLEEFRIIRSSSTPVKMQVLDNHGAEFGGFVEVDIKSVTDSTDCILLNEVKE
jgi:hypothetical protein